MLLSRNFQRRDAPQVLLYVSAEGSIGVEAAADSRVTLIADAPGETPRVAPADYDHQRVQRFQELHPYADPDRLCVVTDFERRQEAAPIQRIRRRFAPGERS